MEKHPVIKALIEAAVIFAIAVGVAFVVFGGKAGTNRVLNAKVRYFNGIGEMIPLKSFHYIDGATAQLNTLAGDVMFVGTNNVIIIEEDADREQLQAD